jgi:hypothetical protein
MTEISIEIPDSLHKILPVLKKPFLLRVVRNIAKNKIKENKQHLEDAQEHIRIFEQRYKKSFGEFKENFPADADVQAHEDFVEWSYWVEVETKINNENKEFEKLNGIS